MAASTHVMTVEEFLKLPEDSGPVYHELRHGKDGRHRNALSCAAGTRVADRRRSVPVRRAEFRIRRSRLHLWRSRPRGGGALAFEYGFRTPRQGIPVPRKRREGVLGGRSHPAASQSLDCGRAHANVEIGAGDSAAPFRCRRAIVRGRDLRLYRTLNFEESADSLSCSVGSGLAFGSGFVWVFCSGFGWDFGWGFDSGLPSGPRCSGFPKFLRLGSAGAASSAFIDSAMRFAFGSAVSTCTLTICPTFTTSLASFTKRLASSLTCTSPSW